MKLTLICRVTHHCLFQGTEKVGALFVIKLAIKFIFVFHIAFLVSSVSCSLETVGFWNSHRLSVKSISY